MKNQNSHKKSIEIHIKSIQRKIGTKPQINLKPLKRKNKAFIESDAENDSSDLSIEDQQHFEINDRYKTTQNNGLSQIGRSNSQNSSSKLTQNQPVKLYQILQLPTAQYKETENELDLCSICLQQWEQRETYKILPCTHVLHLSCAKDWLTQKNQCPICKLRVFL